MGGPGVAVLLEGPEGPGVELKMPEGLGVEELLYFRVTGVHKMDWGNRWSSS